MRDDQEPETPDQDEDTPSEWWAATLDRFTGEVRAVLEEAAAKLEKAGCPRGVWAAAIREYLERTPLPAEQWLAYAETFERLARDLEEAVEEYSYATDTLYILQVSHHLELEPFAQELPPLPGLGPHTALLRQHAGACRRQAARQRHQRGAGTFEARQLLVDEVAAKTRNKSPTKPLAVLLSTLGSEEITEDALNMARSRRGRRVSRPMKWKGLEKPRKRGKSEPAPSLPPQTSAKPRLVKK